jgi:hypothetical protein
VHIIYSIRSFLVLCVSDTHNYLKNVNTQLVPHGETSGGMFLKYLSLTDRHVVPEINFEHFARGKPAHRTS